MPDVDMDRIDPEESRRDLFVELLVLRSQPSSLGQTQWILERLSPAEEFLRCILAEERLPKQLR